MPDANSTPVAGNMTKFLRQWRAGDDAALERLTAEVYGELRRLAGSVLARHPANPTVQRTSLVHELYLQLPNAQEIDWQSRAHFLNVAAKMMRNILVDHARKRKALKRGVVIPLETDIGVLDRATQIDILLVDNALAQFAASFPRQARVVELRFFGGLTVAETVDVLKAMDIECSARTVERDWTFARAWLQNSIRPD
ncbi:MAG: ECF-type sigma factor [Acidobacteria bacterium]|nr:ECF-type sigma factor [Acidobacteriota bacterium]